MDRIEAWEIFGAVATLRSFSAAARTLGRSPQAVTRAVAALERRLRTRLLNRTTRSVSLTSDGQRYLDRSRPLLADFTQLESPDAALAPLTGRLSVTASVLFGQLHVVPLMTEFLQLHPQLEARLVLLDRVVSLAEEGLDVAVRVGALPDSSLLARPIGHVRMLLCASPRYVKRHGAPRTPAALKQHSCITFLGSSPIAERWSFGSKQSVALRPRLTVNTAQAGIDAAVASFGIVRVFSYQVARELKRKQLQVVLGAYEGPDVPVQLVYPPGPQPRAAAAFLEFATARLRRSMS